MRWTNYHNHSHYDDGKNSIGEHVLAAIGQGVESLGFSGHCPMSFDNHWCMKKENINLYFEDIDFAKEQYSDQIQIYKSLEVDYIPGIVSPADQWIKDLNLDYRIGSVHFAGFYEDGTPGEVDSTHQRFLHGLDNIFQGDIKLLVTEFYKLNRQMIRDARPEVVGHLDKIKMQNKGLWDEHAGWYRNEVLATLEEIRSTNSIVEINTRGIYKKLVDEPYPSKWILEQIVEMRIPVHINSDAHVPREIINNFSETAALIYEIGFREVKVLIDGEWTIVNFDKNGLKL